MYSDLNSPLNKSHENTSFDEKFKLLLKAASSSLLSFLQNNKNAAEAIHINASFLHSLEETLSLLNFGIDLAKKISSSFNNAYFGKILSLRETQNIFYNQLMEIMLNLTKSINPLKFSSMNRPQTILFCGGAKMGKTASIAKLAHLLNLHGYNITAGVCSRLKANDHHAIRNMLHNIQCNIIIPNNNDTFKNMAEACYEIAYTQQSDILLIDTETCLTTNMHFFKQFNDIKAGLKNFSDDLPDHIILVVSALSSNYDLQQLLLFKNSFSINGLIITNTDKTNLGIIINLAFKFNLPVCGISLGSNNYDLQDFSAEEFVNGLLNF